MAGDRLSQESPSPTTRTSQKSVDSPRGGSGESTFASCITAGRLVLSPTRTYAPVIVRALKECRGAIDGMVHCSGGGQTKILHFIDRLHVVKDNLFPVPPLFRLIAEQSGTEAREMYKVFNMGHRMEIYLSSESAAQEIIAISRSFGVDARVVGRVEDGAEARVTIRNGGSEFVYTK